MREPFFFSNNQLFGIYQSAEDQASEKALVICPPLFNEYGRSYRALSDFSTACAKLNYHVLRFDYRGTGDSQLKIGEVQSTDLWVDDIDRAVREVYELSGASSVTLVGIRGGALLASQVAQKLGLPLLAWDPITDGREIDSILKGYRSLYKNRYRQTKRYVGHSVDIEDPALYDISKGLTESLERLVWCAEKQRVSIVQSKGHSAKLESMICKQLDMECQWTGLEDGLIQPREAMEAILGMLAE